MTPSPCAGWAEDRSALVDGALPPARRERLLAHLVHCDDCRQDVAELRRLRVALRRPPGAAPVELTQRLVAIAGGEARAPLWSRPFRRTRPGSLPSRRRRARVRATAAAVTVTAAITCAAGAGYAAGPASAVAAVPDPSTEASAEFGTALAELPLTTDALAAVLTARLDDLQAPVPVSPTFPAQVGDRPLSPAEARATMARAATVADTVGYTGVQVFRADLRGTALRATIQVQAVPGQGTRATVLDPSGRLVSLGVTAAASSARVVDDRLVGLLEQNYTLRAWADAAAAGRPATLVQAERDGHLAARWWIDDASGIVLAQETVDRDGGSMAVGFTSVQVIRSRSILEQLPAQLPVPTTGTALTLSSLPELAASGWTCPDSLADLSLVRVRSDDDRSPSVLHLVYTDGLATLSVFEQRGRLTAAPAAATWDPALRAWTRPAASSLASWQSGGTVFTVVTNGSSDLLAEAVAALPHEPTAERTTLERIRAGWERILAGTKG